MREAREVQLDSVGFVLDRPLLTDVSVVFAPGRVTALSGPSGSGKTTLLSIAGGLLRPTRGEVRYGGEPVWDGSGDPRPEIAFILQVYGLVPILSARENVSIALRARGVDPDEADERAEAALARMHIADLAARQVEELSGGQMQRVACARGLVVEPEVLLADEPTSELDEANRDLVLAELRREADRGAVVVVATHDQLVVETCDAHIALDEGRVASVEAATARPSAVAGTPRHRSAAPDAETRPPSGPAPVPAPEAAPVPAVEAAPELAPESAPVAATSDRVAERPPSPSPSPSPTPAPRRVVSPFARPTDDP